MVEYRAGCQGDELPSPLQRGVVMNKRAAFTALMLLLSSTIALADDNPILGTWRLKSFVREVAATGEKYNQMGEHPNGYLSYSADGRMYAILTMDNRIKPLDVIPTDHVIRSSDARPTS